MCVLYYVTTLMLDTIFSLILILAYSVHQDKEKLYQALSALSLRDINSCTHQVYIYLERKSVILRSCYASNPNKISSSSKTCWFHSYSFYRPHKSRRTHPKRYCLFWFFSIFLFEVHVVVFLFMSMHSSPPFQKKKNGGVEKRPVPVKGRMIDWHSCHPKRRH